MRHKLKSEGQTNRREAAARLLRNEKGGRCKPPSSQLTPQTGHRVEDRFRPPREANLVMEEREQVDCQAREFPLVTRKQLESTIVTRKCGRETLEHDSHGLQNPTDVGASSTFFGSISRDSAMPTASGTMHSLGKGLASTRTCNIDISILDLFHSKRFAHAPVRDPSE